MPQRWRPPAKDYKDMPAVRAAISKKCAGVGEYFVMRYLAEQTARSAAFLADQTEVLGCGAMVQHTSRAVVTTAMVIAPVVFYDQEDGRCVLSLCYRTISLDDEGFGYAQTIKNIFLEAAPPPRVARAGDVDAMRRLGPRLRSGRTEEGMLHEDGRTAEARGRNRCALWLAARTDHRRSRLVGLKGLLDAFTGPALWRSPCEHG